MLRKVISDERGRALAVVLIVLAIGMMILPMFLAQIDANLFASRAIEVGITEYYASDAAIEYALWRIKCEPDFIDDYLTVGEAFPMTRTIGSKPVDLSVTSLSSAGGSNEVDAMLVIDVSLSMADGDGDGIWGECDDDCDPSLPGPHGCCSGDFQPIGNAKIAAKAFVDILEAYSDPSENISHQVGLVSYSTEASLEAGLTIVYTDVRYAIDGLEAEDYTGIGDAIAVATHELTATGRADSVKAIVLLSDGKANVCPDEYPDEWYGDDVYECDPPTHHMDKCYGPCGEYAQDQADKACAAIDDGINFFTVALGTNVDTDLMKYIARFDMSRPDDGCAPRNGKDPGETPDFYQESPSSEDLEDKFRRIALYLTSPQYTIIATTGDTTIESRVQHSAEYDLVSIFTWFTR